MKQITMEEAVRLGAEQEEVFMMIRIRPTTMIEELAAVDGFCTTEPEPPEKKKRNNRVDHGLKPKPKVVDHGKIIACHNAGWSIAKIADEVGCSEQTVRNHIEKEKA